MSRPARFLGHLRIIWAKQKTAYKMNPHYKNLFR